MQANNFSVKLRHFKGGVEGGEAKMLVFSVILFILICFGALPLAVMREHRKAKSLRGPVVSVLFVKEKIISPNFAKSPHFWYKRGEHY